MLFNAYILPTIAIDPSASEVFIYPPLKLEEVSSATSPPGEWILCKERETFEEKTEGGRVDGNSWKNICIEKHLLAT